MEDPVTSVADPRDAAPSGSSRGVQGSPVPETGPYKLNLFVTAVLGIAVSWWIYHFTDWFEAFASLLALGGIFSWLAFVAKILPEARLKDIQDWVDSSVLTRRKLWLAFILIGAVLFVGALCVGTIEVQALRAGGPVRIQKALATEKEVPSWELLSANGHARFVIWSPPWKRTEMLVKVSGLPDRAETVQGLTRVEMQVPDSFRRPVLMLRPTAALTQQLEGQPKVLVVQYRGDHREVRDYHGQSLWINCDTDVDIPPETIVGWRAELERLNAVQLLGHWTNPQSLDRPVWKFEPGRQVEFELRDERNNLVACRGTYTVRALAERNDARQVGILDAKESDNANCIPKIAVSVTPE